MSTPLLMLILSSTLTGGALIVSVGLWLLTSQIVSAYRFTNGKDGSRQMRRGW